MREVMSLACDVAVGDLQGILSNFELAQVSLRNLRDRLVDSTEEECEDASVIIGLYLNYTDQLLSKAQRELTAHQPVETHQTNGRKPHP